ncbi:flagellar hook-length control protein FliK [Psychromonas sp. PT13]|uniref:flagellar hook-length control protein FliK n=1 Tax=Psychromonas sp. PT13 TaxID=3439547 RepID=UPI003EB6F802
MMQSILLATPSSSATGENTQSVTMGSLGLPADDSLTEQVSSNKFSGVLGEAIELPEKTKTNATAAQLLSKITLKEGNNPITVGPMMADLEGDSGIKSTVENTQLATDTLIKKPSQSTDYSASSSLLQSQAASAEQLDSTNILEQIQAAQNIDTQLSGAVKVSEKNSSMQVDSYADTTLPFKATVIANSVANNHNEITSGNIEVDLNGHVSEKQDSQFKNNTDNSNMLPTDINAGLLSELKQKEKLTDLPDDIGVDSGILSAAIDTPNSDATVVVNSSEAINTIMSDDEQLNINRLSQGEAMENTTFTQADGIKPQSLTSTNNKPSLEVVEPQVLSTLGVNNKDVSIEAVNSDMSSIKDGNKNISKEVINLETSMVKDANKNISSEVTNLEASMVKDVNNKISSETINLEASIVKDVNKKVSTETVNPKTLVSPQDNNEILTDGLSLDAFTTGSVTTPELQTEDVESQLKTSNEVGNAQALSDDQLREISLDHISVNTTGGLASSNLSQDTVSPAIDIEQTKMDIRADSQPLTNSVTSEITPNLTSAGQVSPLNSGANESLDSTGAQVSKNDKVGQFTADNTKNNIHQLASEGISHLTGVASEFNESDKASSQKLPLVDSTTSNSTPEKQTEGLIVNHTESAKVSVNHLGEASGLRVSDINASSTHKVEPQSLAASNTALQQTLDLHAKHSAAMIGERVLMMINQGKQEVHIRLDPAELGSMHIKLHMHQDQLNMSIQTDASQSKDIIEQNLPKLREQLAQQGVNLGNTSVEQNARGQQQNTNQQGQSGSQNKSNVSTSGDFSQGHDEEIMTRTVKIPNSEQGIDYYA